MTVFAAFHDDDKLKASATNPEGDKIKINAKSTGPGFGPGSTTTGKVDITLDGVKTKCTITGAFGAGGRVILDLAPAACAAFNPVLVEFNDGGFGSIDVGFGTGPSWFPGDPKYTVEYKTKR